MNKQERIVWNKMKDFFDNTCVRCRGESGLTHLDRDHIIPKYQGGNNEPTNWQPLCARCNASKGPENIDHRIKYCLDNKKEMPKEWVL